MARSPTSTTSPLTQPTSASLKLRTSSRMASSLRNVFASENTTMSAVTLSIPLMIVLIFPARGENSSNRTRGTNR